MQACAVGCYIWGEKLSIMVDVMVLGNSLQEHGVKAAKILCINDDTEKNSIAQLMRAFWHFAPVQHVRLPKHLRGSEQSRLQGVYSKLQTVKMFSSGHWEQRRFLLMDADMLVRANLDDAFGYEVPAAVMRGDADGCLFQKRPSHTFFQRDYTMRRGDSHPTMKGGINAGLILFEPSEDTYEDMMSSLREFVPHGKMAEQEFLSYYWAGDVHAMHKKFNFQIHQLYFSSPVAPPGQERQSSFAYMVDHHEEIRVFHFSADQKPSEILMNEMPSVEGWLTLDQHLEEHARYMMAQHGSRNQALSEHPEWLVKIEKTMRDAYLEWMEAWKRTYLNVVNFVLETAYNKMVDGRTHHGRHARCPSCGKEWDTEEIEDDPSSVRDHLLFNCEGICNIKIPVKHQTNLMTFFFVPCGAQVESKLLYLGEIYRYYVGRRKPPQKTPLPPLPLNPKQQPTILLPFYTIPPFVLATTEDMGVDASTKTGVEPETTAKVMKRRYNRAMLTLRAPKNIHCYKESPTRAEEWARTLANAQEAGTWLIRHETGIEAFAQSKARGSTPASSSSGPPMMMPTPKQRPTARPPAFPGNVTPPWRQHEAPEPPTDATSSAAASTLSMPPPPPPPRR